MSDVDLITLRTALLITLSILLVVLAFRRFRQWVLVKDLPAINHAELLSLDVHYHPARLRFLVKMPQGELLQMALLDTAHVPFHTYHDEQLPNGTHELYRELPEMSDGFYFLEVRSATQRTVRGFRLQQQ